MEPEDSLPFSQEPATGPCLNQMHLVHNFPPYFLNIHSNIILLSKSRSYEWSLPSQVSKQNSVCTPHLSLACCMSQSSILLDLIALIFGEVYRL
jgi:hypothetical protein